jgi:transcriptional regulator of acetoin/glycerol metabolism
LYKVLFDMRNDITELKKVVYGLMPGDHHEVPNVIHNDSERFSDGKPLSSDNAILLNTTPNKPIEVEESLSLMDKEKEMIQRALKKHRSKRKDAARDLGISERTLYRKIKEYKIAE